MSNKIIAYHGTVWEKPPICEEPYIENGMVFDGLDVNRNELNAFYVSDQEDICEFFSDEKSGSDDELFIQVILKIEIDASKIRKEKFVFGKNILLEGMSFDYGDNDDRIRLYDILRSKGYQAFIMESDYTMENGDIASDIAILDKSCFRAIEAKFKTKGQWGEYKIKDEAKKTFIDWSENPENYLEDELIHNYDQFDEHQLYPY